MVKYHWHCAVQLSWQAMVCVGKLAQQPRAALVCLLVTAICSCAVLLLCAACQHCGARVLGIDVRALCVLCVPSLCYRFRDQGLTELLETVYLMTGPQYLSSIQEVIATAGSWQQVEGALFCLRAVAGRIRRHTSTAPANGCNGQADRAQQEQQLLLGLFETVCSPNSRVAAVLNNPYVCATAAGLVGAYAAWFDNTVNSPLEGALRLLLHALSYRDSWQAAAAAFRALTMRCAARLAAVPVLQSLGAAATAAIAPTPQPGQVCFGLLPKQRATRAGVAEVAGMNCMPALLKQATKCCLVLAVL